MVEDRTFQFAYICSLLSNTLFTKWFEIAVKYSIKQLICDFKISKRFYIVKFRNSNRSKSDVDKAVFEETF